MFTTRLKCILENLTIFCIVGHGCAYVSLTDASGRSTLLFASRLERTRILFGTDGPASFARFEPTVQSNPASTQSWMLHARRLGRGIGVSVSTSAATFSAGTRLLWALASHDYWIPAMPTYAILQQ
jgi:hypothetical protein